MSSVRKISPYSTNQGNEGTCLAHSTARLISRLIKSLGLEPGDDYPDEFHDTIMFEEGEILDEYYNTINCSTENTIFHCIIHAQDMHERKGKPFSMHKSLNKVINWESENLSAMLFHFIFNSIKNKYCHLEYLPVRGASAPIFYFLKLLRKGITEDKIKDILRYNDFKSPPPPMNASPEKLDGGWMVMNAGDGRVYYFHPVTKKWSWTRPHTEPIPNALLVTDMELETASRDLPYGWQARMSRTKKRPYWLNTLTGKETWKDPRGVTPPPSPVSPISPSLAAEQSTLGIYVVVGGGLIVPTFQQVQENKIMFSRLITKLTSVFELLRISFKKKTLKIILARSIGLGDFITINDKYGYRDMTNPSLKRGEMYKGIGTHIYTSLSSTSKHTDWFEKITRVLEYGLYVLLTIYEHAILITAIEGDFFIVKNSWGVSKNWTLPNGEQFIVDNKLSISTLVDHATRDERPRDVELLFIELGGRDNYEIFTKKKLPNKSIIHTLKKTAKRLSACFGMGKKNKTQKKFKKYHKKLSKNDKTIKKCLKKTRKY
jgi:hypothetical protein